MNAKDMLGLLEREWQNIRQHLGENWHEFHTAFRQIVSSLPQDVSPLDLERITDEIGLGA